MFDPIVDLMNSCFQMILVASLSLFGAMLAIAVVKRKESPKPTCSQRTDMNVQVIYYIIYLDLIPDPLKDMNYSPSCLQQTL